MLSGEYRIPSCRYRLVLEAETSEGELSFANTAEQFNTGDGGSCTIKVLEAEHRPCSGFNPPVILFDQICSGISTISTWYSSRPRLPLASRAPLGTMQRSHRM